MKLANFFILLLSFNLISVERDQLDVDFLSDDEYRIDLIFIKYLKDEDLKENFQNPEVNFERFFVALNEFQYPNLDIVPTNFEIPKENQSIDIPFIKKETQKKTIEKNIITRKREFPREIFQIDKRDDNLMKEFKDLIRRVDTLDSLGNNLGINLYQQKIIHLKSLLIQVLKEVQGFMVF